jgi:hypothetical protein
VKCGIPHPSALQKSFAAYEPAQLPFVPQQYPVQWWKINTIYDDKFHARLPAAFYFKFPITPPCNVPWQWTFW